MIEDFKKSFEDFWVEIRPTFEEIINEKKMVRRFRTVELIFWSDSKDEKKYHNLKENKQDTIEELEGLELEVLNNVKTDLIDRDVDFVKRIARPAKENRSV